jgi:hypothetical protein
MAGSKRNMLYETDIPASTEGEYKWLVLNLDEGNSKTLGMQEATPGNLSGKEFAVQGSDFLYIRPRYVLLEGETSGGKTVRRKWVAGDPANTLVVNGGTTVQGVFVGPNTVEDVTFAVTGIVGEKRTLVASVDTGLDDGTST